MALTTEILKQISDNLQRNKANSLLTQQNGYGNGLHSSSYGGTTNPDRQVVASNPQVSESVINFLPAAQPNNEIRQQRKIGSGFSLENVLLDSSNRSRSNDWRS